MHLKRLLTELASDQPSVGFQVTYWDSETCHFGSRPPAFHLHFRNRECAEKLMLNPSVFFGEAYMDGTIAIDGDMQAMFAFFLSIKPNILPTSLCSKLQVCIMRWIHLQRHRRVSNVTGHYDLGNRFFSEWLGLTMNYSCAYFSNSHDSIDQAQRQKMEHICKKLRLRNGKTLLDIGCGWGALAIHAAKHFEVSVHGITLSKQQLQFAEAWALREGMQDRVTFEVRDYRELSKDIKYDALVSVGMAEHVGKMHIPQFLSYCRDVLRPQGTAVLHTIGRHTNAPFDPWMQKHIFPGAYIPTLQDLAVHLGNNGLQITDVEVLRRHYHLTLLRWIDNFERMAQKWSHSLHNRFIRMWRFYLNASAAAFAYGDLTLWQIQFTNGCSAEIPLTRDYLYKEVRTSQDSETLRKFQAAARIAPTYWE